MFAILTLTLHNNYKKKQAVMQLIQVIEPWLVYTSIL